ncbi:MAG TPA: RNA polymerase sigma factor [Vicinamibacteria bacterium]|nr:RNA polymerase sigma factor [Vicinamibacteria bacterium]
MSDEASVNPGAGPSAGQLSDQEVVRRVRGGEGPLFELLMRRYNQRLFRVARAIVRNDAEAEDVMQQAYVNAYTHLDQFAERAQFSTWLTRIAVHEALARVRRRRRLTEIETMTDTDDADGVLRSRDPNPEQQALTGELRAALESSLDAIPEIYRTAFVLREVEGLSTTEAAECLETSDDVVKTRLHRARTLLRRELLQRAGSGARQAFSFHATRCDRVVALVLATLGLAAAPRVH